MSEQEKLLLTIEGVLNKYVSTKEKSEKLYLIAAIYPQDIEDVAKEILAKVKQYYKEECEYIGQCEGDPQKADYCPKQKRLDRPDNITTMDEYYEKYLPKYAKKYPITIRVTKEEERYILFHREEIPFKEVQDG